MMVVPINVPDYIFVDNMSVLNVASIPKCKISKKHLGIFYYNLQEASAAGIGRVDFF